MINRYDVWTDMPGMPDEHELEKDGKWCKWKDVELLTANNSDRKKLIDEILTAIQDGDTITGDMLNDWGQCEYGISHRTGAKG